ncbi:MAG: twin-arginine translocation signal domain-containing protein [Rhodospirillales bacterium]
MKSKYSTDLTRGDFLKTIGGAGAAAALTSASPALAA